MSNPEIKSAIENLVQCVENAAAITDDDKKQLLDLAKELEFHLKEPSANPAEDFIEKFQQATERFETEHPDLTAVAGRIATMLSNMGI